MTLYFPNDASKYIFLIWIIKKSLLFIYYKSENNVNAFINYEMLLDTIY